MKSRNFRQIFLTVLTIALLMVMATGGAVLAAGGDQPTYYFLGSSVTAGMSNKNVSFADMLAEKNGWTCVKEAVSGTTLFDDGERSYVQRMINNIDPSVKMDHLIVQLSTNDATKKLPLGSVSTSTKLEDFDTSTVTGAMEYIIAYAQQTWQCPVSFFTNPALNIPEYMDMIESLYLLQDKWGIGILDYNGYKNMDPVDEATMSTFIGKDFIHPTAAGYEWMTGIMSDYLIANDVTATIAALPASITSADAEAVEKAAADFAALTDAQKKFVAADQQTKLTDAQNASGSVLLPWLIGGGVVVVLIAVVVVLVVRKRKASSKT